MSETFYTIYLVLIMLCNDNPSVVIGIEFGAMLEKFKFLFENGIQNINKVAVVTDKRWLHKVVGLEDKIFKNIEMQCFSLKEKKQAVEFLKEAGKGN